MNLQNDLINSIYIHIPFCRKKCDYCDFYSIENKDPEIIDKYMLRLREEMEFFCARYGEGHAIESLYVGGGTPSVLEPHHVTGILAEIRKRFHVRDHAEITFEMNPSSGWGPDTLDALAEGGVNRISMGIQTMSAHLLNVLGRKQKADDVLRMIEHLNDSVFDNVSFDILSGIPGQTLSDIDDTLALLFGSANHISAYALTIPDSHTRFPHALPSGDHQGEHMDHVVNTLEEHGFHRYEISNFARENHVSRHNLNYWRRRGCLSLGAGAVSTLKIDYGYRYRRGKIHDYMNCSFQNTCNKNEEEWCTRDHAIAECVFLGFRTMRGVDEKEFAGEFGTSFRDMFSERLDELLEDGFIIERNHRYRFSGKGLAVCNSVLTRLLDI